MILRIWDCYIIKGEMLIYEISLAILKIQEKDLMNVNYVIIQLPVNNILKNLKKFPSKIQEEDFFNLLQEIDVKLF